MTTNTTTSVIDHTSDAGFRAWVTDFHNLISGAGLIQTADTGQINLVTVTRPAANTMAGYSIWKLPGADPLFFKFQFGTGTTSTRPVVQCQVGEGSNGTGTLTGQTTTNVALSITNVDTNNIATLYTSYCCVNNDYIGFTFKPESSGSFNARSRAFLVVGKTTDTSGVTTTLGYYKLYNTGSSNTDMLSLVCVRRQAPAVTMLASNRMSIDPTLNQVNSQDDSGNLQHSLLWGVFKTVTPLFQVCSYRTTEIATLATFSVATLGATPHTYLTMGNNACCLDNGGSLNVRLAILYE